MNKSKHLTVWFVGLLIISLLLGIAGTALASDQPRGPAAFETLVSNNLDGDALKAMSSLEDYDSDTVITMEGFKFDKDTGTILRYCGNSLTPVVPSAIDGVTVTTIGEAAFSGSAITSVTVSEGVTVLQDSVFSYCSALASVNLPDSVAAIGVRAFSSCSALAGITLPSGVMSVSGDAFYGCGIFTDIDVAAANPYLSSDSGVLFNKDKTELLIYPNGKSAVSYAIPGSVKGIGDKAFFFNNTLTGITITPGVETIGEMAFHYCSKLSDIFIPGSVVSIGDSAFEHCGSAASLTISDGVETIGSQAFCNCYGLTTVDIPASVTSIGYAPFHTCSNLQTIDVSPLNTHFVSDAGVLLSADGTRLIQCPEGLIAASYAIPAGVTTIGESAFESCSNLNTITIPNGVQTIEDRAFIYCTGAAAFNLPGTVASIGTRAFEQCNALTSITIPGSVKTIGDYAFSSCAGLTNVTLENGIESIGQMAFGSCGLLPGVAIPQSVTSFGPAPFHFCSSLTDIDVAEGSASFASEGGVLFNKDKTALVQYPRGKSAKEYTVPAGVTTIETYAFSINNTLTSITLPDSLETIGQESFRGCSALTSIIIPENVDTFEYGAFIQCTALADVEIEDGVKEIGEFGFYGCNMLQSISIPDSVASIGGMAFYQCSALGSVTIPDAVTCIYQRTFGQCASLASVTLPRGLELIDYMAFADCGSLNWINILDNVCAFAPNAFENTPGIRIYGIADTHAQDVAIEYGYPFITTTVPTVTVEAGETFTNHGGDIHKISCTIDEPGALTLRIVDANQNTVRDLLGDEQFDSSGTYIVYWDGEDNAGSQSASGAYVIDALIVNGHNLKDDETQSLTYDNQTGIVPVTSIAISDNEKALTIGRTHTLVATVSPQDTTTNGITWTSSNSAVASVSGGVVTGKAAGAALITAESDGKIACCAISVRAAGTQSDQESVVLFSRSKIMTVGSEAMLTTAAQSFDVVWSSSDTAVAAVDASGKVRAVSEGVAVIIAETDGAFDVWGISVIESAQVDMGDEAVEETKAEETQDEDTQTEDTQVVEKADDVYTNAENTGDMPGGGMNPGWWALIGFGGAGLLAGGAAWLATRRK